MSKKRKFLEKWFRKVWTEEDASAIDKMFVPKKGKDAKTALGLIKDEGLDPAGFKEFHQVLLRLVGDIRINIDSTIEKGDWIVASCSLTATSRRDNSKVTQMTGCVIGEIDGGKLRYADNYWDFITFFEGLDLLPDQTLIRCLTGEGVR